MDHETIELAFVIVGALALLTQTAILLAIYLGVSKAAKSMKEEIEELRSSVVPVVRTTRNLLDHVGPKVEQTANDLAALTHSLRAQAMEMEGAVTEIVDRVRKETGRIDTMFSNTLDAVDKASAYVTQTVSKPVRQLSGILASFKAIVESLRSNETSFREPVIHNDKDMFV